MSNKLNKVINISNELTNEYLVNPDSTKTLINKELLDSLIEEILEERRKSNN
jgi:hypothetical protein|tara:strand:- start:759 stop:914 length:156 start_codon:yes stop_codon:yes gene_type:complete